MWYKCTHCSTHILAGNGEGHSCLTDPSLHSHTHHNGVTSVEDAVGEDTQLTREHCYGCILCPLSIPLLLQGVYHHIRKLTLPSVRAVTLQSRRPTRALTCLCFMKLSKRWYMMSAVKIFTPRLSAISCASLSTRTSKARMTAH